ncbi:choline transporter-like protein 4 isoform X3 [Rhipicephalus sanguineus]|uniref:choline transporter-like protein 4 isoform X3 n=1 Tax=Rhipicephalus sanguineus TaxID=34632 RepID=UPI001894D5B4|nr:choline transporter-like protein 4 isoform X3 [Rhipicephalus sanguineus]
MSAGYPQAALLEMSKVGETPTPQDVADYGEPRKFDPGFKGPLKNRSCTDIICLFLFVFFLFGWAIVAFFAYRNGNPERLIYPTDSDGNICGQPPYEDKQYLFFFDITQCLKRAYKPGDLLPSLICNTPQVCVSHCPNETFWVDNAKKEKEDLIRSKLICQYGVDPLDKKSTLEELTGKDQKCASYYLKSSSVARRCLPGRLELDANGKVKDMINDNGIVEAVSAKGLAKKTKNSIELILAGLSSAKDVGELAFQDFKTAWPHMLIGLLCAMLVAFLWIALMRWLAAVMVWLSILCLVLLFSFGSYYSFSKYVELRNSMDSGSENLIKQFDVSVSFTQNLRAYSANKNTWLVLGIVSVVILVVLLLLLIFLRKRIVIAIALIKEASRAVALMPSALFFPILPYLLHLLLFAFWGSVAVYLASSGTAEFKYMNMTDGNNSMTTQSCSAKDFNKTLSQLRCQFTQYVANQHLSRLQIYNFIGLIWGMFFIVGLGQVALAAAFASYYWAFRKPQDVPFFAVLNGLWITVRYHLGSVAFGSLILTIVRVIRIVLEYIDEKLKKYDNEFTRCLMRCCKCCFWCLEKFLKFLNKNAYIMIAIYGKNFCTSAKEAFKLLMRNVVRVVVLDKVTDLLLLVGKLVIVGIVAVPTFLVFSRKVDALNNHLPELNYYMLPILTISVGAYIIASSFFSVYSMAVDTLFLCFLEDCERHDGSEEKPYYMSKELMKILGKQNRLQEADK